jgi:hypothetical protein
MADPSGSGSFPRIPQELAHQVQQKIVSLMENATTAATQGLVAVEELVASGGHSGLAAQASHQKAIEINNDLTQVIHGCNELAEKLRVSVAKFGQQDLDAYQQIQSMINPA